MQRYQRDSLVFDVRDAGPPDGPVVVLPPGLPQRNDSWNAVKPDRLADLLLEWFAAHRDD